MKAVWVLLMIVVSSALAGCNTISGAGEDLEAAGGAIERKAEEVKGY